MENKHKHLEFIQDIIERLSKHSFQLKSWSVIVVAAILSLESKHPDRKTIYISFIPVIIFWVLDGIYLYKERMFRSLYEHVRKLPENEIDFNMDTDKFYGSKNSWIASLFSSTIGIFYISLIISITLVIVFIKK